MKIEPKNSNKGVVSDDILHHFELIAIDLQRLRLDYNRDVAICYKVENLINKLEVIIQLYLMQDKPIFRALKIKINNLIKDNPTLKGIILHIENNRCTDECGHIEKFKIVI